MKVTVRTIVRLGAHLPPGRQGNRAELDVAADATPADIIRQLGFTTDRNYLVKVNGEIVPQPRHGLARLRDNDELTILPKPKYG